MIEWHDIKAGIPNEDGRYLVNMVINGDNTIFEAEWDISNEAYCFSISDPFARKIIGFWKEQGYKREEYNMAISHWAFPNYPQERK